jgi:O-antigen/teichoic acid export membrane protein
MNDSLSSYTKKILVLSGGNTAYTLINGLFFIYLARVLGPELRGSLALMVTTPVIVGYLMTFGVQQSAPYFARSQRETGKSIRSVVIFVSAALFLVSVGIFLTSDTILFSLFGPDHPLSAHELMWMAAYGTLTWASTTFGACLITLGETKKFSLINRSCSLLLSF